MMRILVLLVWLLPLLAAPQSMKLEEVIAQEDTRNHPDLTVDLNLHNGKVLVLSDGTSWEVAPQDLTTSQSWILPSPLLIEKSNNTYYPYKLINKATNSCVLVRPIASQKS